MTKNGAQLTSWHISFKDMQVRPTNRGFDDLNDCIGSFLDDWFRVFFQVFLICAFLYEGLHKRFLWR